MFECRACDYMHPIAKAKARKWEAMIPFRRAFFRRAGKQELLLDAAVAAVDEVMGVSDAQ